ncbi:hypothetical protein IHQ56_07735 [Methylobacillus flagellatus]|uniref:hypothetical protein n=1 Tax=Methylobacillus flagellatus TaxID=405 RepID=UPI002853C0E1|nr:hypothetical protein [Methylobacillus flagellatus]MDR5171703.1 hypothetical protein [Methylobacillus flagellatus]
MTIQQQEWLVAGIKHEIFMRIFPTLRHGLVGPISIARMSASIVRRLLSKGESSKAALGEPVERIDQQLAEAVAGIRALQAWEPEASGLAIPAEILRQGIALMTAPLALRDIKMDYVPSDIQDLEEVRQQPFLYAWLALLCYFEDQLNEPATLRLEQKEPRSVCVEVTRPFYDVNQTKGRAKAHARIIDKFALEAVANAGGFRLKFGQEWASFSWT